MNKTTYILFLMIMTASCKKALPDVQDYFPKVTTLSAEVQMDGTLLVTGELVSEGEAPVEYLGFCCGTTTLPDLLDRQLAASNFEDGKFYAVYEGDFDPDSVYYIRSWATNEYGYVYGNVISQTNIIATPVVPPCTQVLNTGSIGGQPTTSFTNVSAPDPGFQTWKITATGNSGPDVYLLFGSAPTTGVYKTVDFNSPAAGQVYVSFYQGQISDYLETGSNVYVNRISAGVFDISICNAPWIFTSGNPIYFNMRIKSPT